MKARSLLLLRAGTGLLMVVWGLVRLLNPAKGAGVSSKYYSGLGTSETIQLIWGIALLMVGILTVLGLFRRIVYPAQALILVTGAVSIWKFLLDPLGLWLLDKGSNQILFFPSLTVAAATLVLIAFRDEDALSLDAMRARR